MRRLGYAGEEWEVKVGAGCDNAIEMRLAVQGLCLFPCPPARVPPVIRSCRGGA